MLEDQWTNGVLEEDDYEGESSDEYEPDPAEEFEALLQSQLSQLFNEPQPLDSEEWRKFIEDQYYYRHNRGGSKKPTLTEDGLPSDPVPLRLQKFALYNACRNNDLETAKSLLQEGDYDLQFLYRHSTSDQMKTLLFASGYDGSSCRVLSPEILDALWKMKGVKLAPNIQELVSRYKALKSLDGVLTRDSASTVSEWLEKEYRT